MNIVFAMGKLYKFFSKQKKGTPPPTRGSPFQIDTIIIRKKDILQDFLGSIKYHDPNPQKIFLIW